MTLSHMLLEIVTPERKVFEKQIDMVVVKAIDGELGILPNHIPLVTPLKIGVVRAKHAEDEELVAVSGGFMEVRNNKVVILAESAELPGDIDLERALAAKVRAEKRMEQRRDEIDFRRAEIALQKALNRIEVAGKHL